MTLIFSLERHREVAEAYVRGVQRLADAGGDLSTMASVASFFVSRVDTEADKRLDEVGGHDELKGTLAIANAKLAYVTYQEVFAGDAWEALAAKGASAQRCLWASTSTKNPAYRDVLYVEELIGPDTVNTMPRETVEAFLDHGEVRELADRGRRRRAPHARGVRRRRDRLRRRRRHARARGRGEVRELVQAAVRRRRREARAAGGGRVSADRERELGQQLRVDSVRSSAAAGSGHPTSSMSAADLMAVLLEGGFLHWDTSDLSNPADDHLIFSKGHASPLYYAVLKAAGIIDDAELLTFRKLGSRLEGHPTPRIPPTDVATGSLGQGLPIAVGVALAGKRLDRLPYRVWCLCGDSEMAEGSIWEAFEHAGFNGLDNLTAIIDVNRLGQTRETMVGWDLDRYKARAEAFGWHAIEIDGHDVEAIDAAFDEAVATTGRPTVIIAKTKKGKGVKAVEDQPGKHGKPLDDPDAAIAELGGERDLQVTIAAPASGTPHRFEAPGGELPAWDEGEQVATRKAYGEALTALGVDARRRRRARRRGLQLDALGACSGRRTRTATSRCSSPSSRWSPRRSGMQVRGWVPFASTFAAFLSRAYDFVRMAAISRANLRLSGSHAGVSIGEDGPSQMALEDIASFRAIHGSTVLHPSDANQTAQLVAAMADREGISFLRTLRGKTTVRTPAGEAVTIGGVARPARGRRRRDRGLRHHRRPGRRGGRGARRRRASPRA